MKRTCLCTSVCVCEGEVQTPRFEISVCISCIMSFISQWWWPCQSWGKEKSYINTGSHPCRPIHSLLSLNILPWTFPSLCIFLSFHPPLSLSPSLPLQLSASLTQPQSVYGRWLGSLKGTGRHWSWAFKWLVPATPPLSLSLCLPRLLEVCPKTVSIFDRHALLTQQRIEPQLDPEVLVHIRTHSHTHTLVL